MKLATTRQCQKIDAVTQEKFHISSETLMESAGSIAAQTIAAKFAKSSKIVILCGPGNNGGDGLVIARQLNSQGYQQVEIIYTPPLAAKTGAKTEAKTGKDQNKFQLQLSKIDTHKIKTIKIEGQNLDHIKQQLESADLIVDALFGIGLTRPIEGVVEKIILAANLCKATIISIDCPSGLNCNHGQKDGACIHAHSTLTFGISKPGFYLADGPEHTGNIQILPIGFPSQLVEEIAHTHELFDKKEAEPLWPHRPQNSNKSDFGGALIIAGQEGMWGAGILASTAAFRSGTGYVIWASHQSPSENLKQIPEVMTSSCSDPNFLTNPKISAIAAGPGLGVHEKTKDVIQRLKNIKDTPVLLDADALTVCCQYQLFPLPSHWVITPHTGELTRILKSAKVEIDVEKDRFTALEQAAKIVGCKILLKGFHSVLLSNKHYTIINAGNSALASAGTGDVLTGIMAGLLAQKIEIDSAIKLASYLHGSIADAWVQQGQEPATFMASDIANGLNHAVAQLCR